MMGTMETMVKKTAMKIPQPGYSIEAVESLVPGRADVNGFWNQKKNWKYFHFEQAWFPISLCGKERQSVNKQK